jgi:ribosomal protein RSM22 (predicted rRNA methylase)
MELIHELQEAISKAIATIPAQRLQRVAEGLSQRYRASSGKAETIAIDADGALAYAAHRMPATYAALYAALEASRGCLASEPRSLLDLGAGTGAALWAAGAIWPELAQATCLERQPAMLALGRELASGSQHPAIARAEWRRADLAAQWVATPADLVTAGYLLNELSPAMGNSLVTQLWGATRQLLILVEPGTPAGFAHIRAARDQLLALGGHIVAPCPHQGSCPMADGDWCHFAQRLVRPTFQRRVKGAELGYEDEKFSYVAVARSSGTPVAARVLRHPRYLPGRVELILCTPGGLQQRIITKSKREAYRVARDVAWGDEFAGD